MTRSMRPGRGVITQMRLESCTASSMEWVTKTTVGRLVIHSVCRSVRMPSRVMASSLPSGSSRSSVCGSCTIAWQKAARCCMPPESSQGWRRSKPMRRTDSSRFLMRPS